MSKTITSIFLVPTLKIPKGSLKSNGFINGYIKDEINNIKYDDCLYLLFRPTLPSQFRTFLNHKYERTKSIIKDYDLTLGFVVVVYRLNLIFTPDYELVKKSKYSKTSENFQSQFPKTIEILKNDTLRKEFSLQYRVFNKTPDLKEYWRNMDPFFKEENELWYDFQEEKETLTEETLKDLVFNKYIEDKL